MVVRRLNFVPVFVSFVACGNPTSPDAASSGSDESLSNGDDPDMTGPPEATTTSSSDPASSSDDGTTAAEPATTGGESTGVVLVELAEDVGGESDAQGSGSACRR